MHSTDTHRRLWVKLVVIFGGIAVVLGLGVPVALSYAFTHPQVSSTSPGPQVVAATPAATASP